MIDHDPQDINDSMETEVAPGEFVLDPATAAAIAKAKLTRELGGDAAVAAMRDERGDHPWKQSSQPSATQAKPPIPADALQARQDLAERTTAREPTILDRTIEHRRERS